MNLNLYDHDLNRIATIGNRFVSCLWSEGYNTTQDFCLELVETEEYKRKVRPDCYVGRTDRPTLMVIKSVVVRGGHIIATGKEAKRVMHDVAFVGTISSGSPVDTAVKNAYNKSNQYHKLTIADSDLGVAYNYQISHKSILELCETMGQDTDVGFRSVRDDDQISVEFYQPALNPNLIISREIGNISNVEFSASVENYKNYAIVLGEGEGADRVRVDVDRTDGAERRDLIVDAKDIRREDGETESEYNARLTARGVGKLLEHTQTLNTAFLPYAVDFGKRYDLGDILTVRLPDYGMTLQARVSRFTQKAQGNSTETTIEVGKITVNRR
jgi:hypothetical protein